MKNTPKPPINTAKFIYVPKNKGESSNKLETPKDYKCSIDDSSAKDGTT